MRGEVFKTRTINIAFVCLSAVCCLAPMNTYAIVVGRAGTTYPIIEKDAMSELMHRVRQVDWKKQFAGLKQEARDFQPQALPNLPRAARDRSFLVDPTYTLKRDIPDGKGGILYAKGYTFNPLDYVSLPDVLVFMDGSDPHQVQWFQKSVWSKYGNVDVFLTGGGYEQVERELRRPVFYAVVRVVKRFRITAVPSVLYQRGKLLEVDEFEIKK